MLKVTESLWDDMSFEIQFTEDEKRAWLGQPFLIESLQKKFGKKVMKGHSPKMPGMLMFSIVRPFNNAEKNSVKDKKLFQSGIRMLIYIVKHPRPDITNTTQELSKVVYRANYAVFLEMNLIIMFLIQEVLYWSWNHNEARKNTGKTFVSEIVNMQEIQSQGGA